jgi:hypothetical protein
MGAGRSPRGRGEGRGAFVPTPPSPMSAQGPPQKGQAVRTPRRDTTRPGRGSEGVARTPIIAYLVAMTRAHQFPDPVRYHRSLRQLRQRQAAFCWWLMQREKFPLGLVSIPTAARMLGLSRCRMHNLVREGRFKIVEGMPGGGKLDRFVAVHELMNAPVRMNQGRPGLFGGAARRAQPTNRITGETTGTRSRASTSPALPKT